MVHSSASNEKKTYPEFTKTRPVIVNSKIPVLARVSGRKQTSEEPIAMTKTFPMRALSAERHNTLPSFQVRYSATQRRVSNGVTYESRGQNILMDRSNKEAVLRKISPANSPVGRQPILVRSPSLNSLGQLQNDVNSSNQVLYGAYTPHPKGMGNIGSYFRNSPGGVVV
ncbi:hypothetical protein X975_26222, partial [Stegodyphus mimosarum]